MAAFFRRSVLSAVGGFSTDYFLYFEDFDLSGGSCVQVAIE